MAENNYLSKEELLQQAKQLSESEDLSKALAKINDLKKKWRKTREEEESMYDKEMSEQFYAYLDKLNAKEDEIINAVKQNKQAIIERAKEIVQKANYKKGNSEMDKLLEEWKACGRSNKKTDDSLWEEFRNIRNEFFNNKKEYFDDLFKKFDENKNAKEDIINKAIEANKLTNFKEINSIMEGLMEDWKKTGSAGKENDDDLWKKFSAERKNFFNNRSKYFDELKETFANRVEAKKEIINETKKYLATSEFSEEEINNVKQLRNKWKEVGFAGKENDDELYDEFNKLLNKYFDNLKLYK